MRSAAKHESNCRETWENVWEPPRRLINTAGQLRSCEKVTSVCTNMRPQACSRPAQCMWKQEAVEWEGNNRVQTRIMQPSGSAAHLEAVVKPFFFSTGAARIVSKELQVIIKVTMNFFPGFEMDSVSLTCGATTRGCRTSSLVSLWVVLDFLFRKICYYCVWVTGER